MSSGSDGIDNLVAVFSGNLCPQFIMPSPKTEHLSADPMKLADPKEESASAEKLKRDLQDRMTLMRCCHQGGATEIGRQATHLLRLLRIG